MLNEQGLLSDELVTAPCDALVLPMTEDMGYAVAAATALRKKGLRTQLYGEKKKFKAKMGYADKIGVPFAVLIGEDEMRDGVLSVKDMQTGEQVRLAPDEAADYIAEKIAALNAGSVIKE